MTIRRHLHSSKNDSVEINIPFSLLTIRTLQLMVMNEGGILIVYLALEIWYPFE